MSSDEPQTLASGGYWHHQQRFEPHAAVHDEAFQTALLAQLARAGGVNLPQT
ncbi:hypothetical protein ACF0H2_04000 [Serratia marcescens]